MSLFESTPTCLLRLSISEALYEASKYHRQKTFVVGGASTYEQFAPLVDRYLVTVVDKVVENADAFLPESIFGDPSEWNVQAIAEYPPIAGVDEVGFTIFEWTAKDAACRLQRRNEMVEQYASRNHLLRPNKKRIGIQLPSASAVALELHL